MTQRTIRKYANRRLYDSQESRHLTLDEVRQLVVDGEHIRVEDAKTGEDLTRSILLQIIVEREEAGEPLLSAPLLEHLIRFYGGEMQGFLASYLERSVEAFASRHEALREQFVRFVSENPMTELTRRNLALWEQLQNQLLDVWNRAPQKDDDDSEAK
jgi:polyhydroxyalkanoate synthesis repressor PhaR